MNRKSCLRAAAILSAVFAIVKPAAAEALNWDMTGEREFSSPLSKLPPKDQQEISHRLGIKPAKLNAIRINTQSTSLFFVQGVGDMCGASNCDFWVLTSDYKVLLKKVIETFKLTSNLHDGLPDIITSMHGSAFDSALSYWRFDGRRYIRIACADAVYGDIDGKTFKKPHTSPQPCGTRG